MFHYLQETLHHDFLENEKNSYLLYTITAKNGKEKFEMNTDMGVPAKCPYLPKKKLLFYYFATSTEQQIVDNV